MVKQKLWSHAILLFLSFFLLTCSSQQTQKDHSTSSKPEITIQVASLSLANYNRRIERNEVRKLATLLKKEQVEVLAVQAITRYPGVETRVDFVDELAKQADINSAFGEMINNSGRQTGNAVFSSYPIRSKFNQSFDRVRSAKFEAALQVVIDGGTRAVHVICTQLPKATLEDQIACVAVVSSMTKTDMSEAIILTGNLPVSEKALGGSGFQDVQQVGGMNAGTRIWYVPNNALNVISIRSVETDFGTMLIAQFGLFRQTLP